MRTFYVQTLGCKVNQYESEQVAAFLRSRGLVEAESAEGAELRIINSCSVTVQAASQSRQSVRRATRLAVISGAQPPAISPDATRLLEAAGEGQRSRVVVIGCWATSDREAAGAIEGVDAVLTHQDDVGTQLDRLLTQWRSQNRRHIQGPSPVTRQPTSHACNDDPRRGMMAENKDEKDDSAAEEPTLDNKPRLSRIVNEIPGVEGDGLGIQAGGGGSGRAEASSKDPARREPRPPGGVVGAMTLPVLGEHQSGRQRAFLKIQDGCDAHCTYCIIPRLRPVLWSKPVEEAVGEAQRLVRARHREIVLTGIFLGAYGQATALRRRRDGRGMGALAELVEALCTRVEGLERLRLSSLEPGDVDEELLAVLAAHRQVVPHFHLPLQSGSDEILRRMNRQYRRADFEKLVERMVKAFDRPALTTDIIVGFPGESDEQFRHTVEVVEASRFVHVHAFPYSPRPGTAAARWKKDQMGGTVVNERIRELGRLSRKFDVAFREAFLGSEVTVVVERGVVKDGERVLRRGRCERYFAVEFEGGELMPGDVVRVKVEEVAAERTLGRVVR